MPWCRPAASPSGYAPRRATALAIALAGALAAQVDDRLTDVDRKVLGELAVAHATPRAVFHSRDGALPAGVLEADIAANLAALEQLEQTLAMRYRGQIHVFLYADADEMRRLTGAGDGTAAFSTGTVSVHQPHDFRGVHEFVHIYALQFERPADTAGADLFVTEGLATWLAESDQGIPIHEWAAVDQRASLLPPLLDLRRTFPQGAPKGVHPYHVAGSFVGYLLQRFGMAKVKQWYVDSTEAHAHFGEGMAALERQWREYLATVVVEPDHERHVLQRLGLAGEPMPAAWASTKGTALFDGKSLAGLDAEDRAHWRVDGGVLVGSNDGPWTHLATKEKFGPDIGVRAQLRLAEGNAVKVRLGDREAIFATWSSYASSGGGYTDNERQRIAVGRPCEVVVVRQGGRARVFLDGVTVFDLAGAWDDKAAGSLALAVERGVVEVTEWVAFDPR